MKMNDNLQLGLNNALMKKYPSKDSKLAGELYSAIKPLIVDKKGR